MSDYYVAQLRHYLNEDDEIPLEIPNEARIIASFFGGIVAWVTKLVPPGHSDLTNSPCIGTLRGKACCTPLIASFSTDSTKISWECPSCETAGEITNWESTPYDRRGDA